MTLVIPPRLRTVRQTNEFNCGEACLATVLSTSIEDVQELVGRDVSKPIPGMGDHPDLDISHPHRDHAGLLPLEMVAALGRVGVMASLWASRAAWDGTWIGDHWESLRLADVEWLNDRLDREGCAILAVDSLNHAESQHWVVWYEGMVLDPSTKKRYPEDSNLSVYDAVIIRKSDLPSCLDTRI